jgi:hypothetical protein
MLVTFLHVKFYVVYKFLSKLDKKETKHEKEDIIEIHPPRLRILYGFLN